MTRDDQALRTLYQEWLNVLRTQDAYDPNHVQTVAAILVLASVLARIANQPVRAE